MPRCQGNNPKRRIAPIHEVDPELLARIENEARYTGSALHKRQGADYGFGIHLDDITQGQTATHREERSVGTSTMPVVPEQQPLFFRRPTHQPRPPDSCTRVDGCNGAAFETISRSLRLCGDESRTLD